METEVAILGGGCFWCTEAVFQKVPGVKKIESGYAGGFIKNPAYREVCNGTTGHAEVVWLEFNPQEVSYEKILRVFFLTHDPSTLNQQGNDIGTQYRSVIFFMNEGQQQQAEKVKKEIDSEGIYTNPVVTEIVPFLNFYKAEDYHQNYYTNNKSQPYCSYVIAPKLEKLGKLFSAFTPES
jgi:peptide-methionine (S)-S-oxide reductase